MNCDLPITDGQEGQDQLQEQESPCMRRGEDETFSPNSN